MTAAIHLLICYLIFYIIFCYLILCHIIFQNGKRRWLSGTDRSIPSSSTSSLGTLEQVEIAAECNQLSNVITYNAMFQIVRLLAITNVKKITKLQKPKSNVPQIYLAYFTNTVIFLWLLQGRSSIFYPELLPGQAMCSSEDGPMGKTLPWMSQ